MVAVSLKKLTVALLPLSPLFPLLPGCRNQTLEPDATVDDDSYYTRGAYYYVQAADDDQE